MVRIHELTTLPLTEFSIPQVAELLEVTPTTIHNYTRTGKRVDNHSRAILTKTNGKILRTDLIIFLTSIK